MSFNEDELEAPKWINDDFLKKVIESSAKGKNVKIKSYQITPATARGDHYASIMFRSNVQYSTDLQDDNTISLIIKTVPIVESYKKELLDSIDVFKKEMYMYNEVLGECEENLRKCGHGELLAPKAIYTSSEPRDVIVFEDLKEKGYFMLPTNIPNEYETRLVFAKLAKYHAITYKMIADGRADLNFKATIVGLSHIRNMPIFLTAPAFMAELLETLPGYESYAKRMKSITIDKLMAKCIDVVNTPSSYSVLNHGDYHIRNMMFKKNEFDVISDIALVDFQIPHYGSPAYDIIYMAAVIPYKLREMTFRHYFNVFLDVLVQTGYKGELPTYEQLQQELEIYTPLDLLFQGSLSVFVHMDRTKIIHEMETLMTNAEIRKSIYFSEDFIAHAKEVLPILLDRLSF